MNQIIAIVGFVAGAIWQVWPLFLISIVLSVLIRALKLDGIIRRAFNTHVGIAILLATFVGAFSPFCSCTVVPVIAGLLMSGVPLAPIMSFWIASPTMDPEIFALSVGILGWPLALARLLATLGVSLAAGYLTWFLTKQGWLLRRSGTAMKRKKSGGQPSTRPAPAYAMAMTSGNTVATVDVATVTQNPVCTTDTCTPVESTSDTESCGCTPSRSPLSWQGQLADSWRKLDRRTFAADVARQSWLLGRWLLLAFIMEAIITSTIPQEAIASLVGDQNLLAIPLATLIGIPLYLNNISALPIVSGLLAQGMQPGAAIAFLIAGPVTTIPAMTAVYGVVGKRIFAWYLGVSLIGAMLMGWLSNWILG